MTGPHFTDRYPGSLPDAQMRRRAGILGGGLVAGLLIIGAAAATSDGGASREAAYKATRLELDTKEGPVECFGRQNITVASGDTVGSMVLRNTALVPDARSWRTPDLDPVVGAILASNGISDPARLQPNEILKVPDFCAFKPGP